MNVSLVTFFSYFYVLIATLHIKNRRVRLYVVCTFSKCSVYKKCSVYNFWNLKGLNKEKNNRNNRNSTSHDFSFNNFRVSNFLLWQKD